MNAKNEFINKVQIYSIDCLIRHYEHNTYKIYERVGHFFSKDTMKFFKSRVNSNLFYDYKNELIYFITSEKKCFNDDTRLYTLRVYNPATAKIDTAENTEFLHFETLAQAKYYAKKLTTKD